MLEKGYQDYKGKGLLMLGVFVGSTEKQIIDFADTYQLSFPVGQDRTIAKELGTRTLPTTFFIDRNGNVTGSHSGVITFEELSGGIEKLLKP